MWLAAASLDGVALGGREDKDFSSYLLKTPNEPEDLIRTLGPKYR